MPYCLTTMKTFVYKWEKTLWTRARPWFWFVMLIFMMGTLLFIFYSSNLQTPWLLTPSTTSSESRLPDINTVTSFGRVSVHREETRLNHYKIIPVQPSKSEYHVSYPGKYLFTLDEPNRCQQESPFLVIMTPVAPHNREARDTIRRTWGSETTVLGQRVSHYFLLGLSDGTGPLQEQLLQESRRHHDILQSNFLDTYKNLTIKTMIMFEWLISHCPNSSYAMKVDSDMFLNVHNLVHMLLKAPRQLYMTGRVERKATVSRNPKSKWYLPVSVFPKSKYPPYAMGLGYVFSLDLPKRVLEASSHVRAIYIEDVYVGMCLRRLRIPLSNPPHRGLFELNIPYPESRCYWTSVITTTVRRSKQLLKVWTKYQTQIKRGCQTQH